MRKIFSSKLFWSLVILVLAMVLLLFNFDELKQEQSKDKERVQDAEIVESDFSIDQSSKIVFGTILEVFENNEFFVRLQADPEQNLSFAQADVMINQEALLERECTQEELEKFNQQSESVVNGICLPKTINFKDIAQGDKVTLLLKGDLETGQNLTTDHLIVRYREIDYEIRQELKDIPF